MKIYLDNCCFNRPFEDQSQLRIRLESEAKLQIQEDIRSGLYNLVWSYILDYESNKNLFEERRKQIAKWREYCDNDIEEDQEVITVATEFQQQGIKKLDSLHISCAIKAKAEYFLTTNDGILKKAPLFKNIKITDPIGFIKEVTT